MAKHVKCQRCGFSDTPKDDMEFETVGIKKPLKKYYHKGCFQEHLKDKEFKIKEAEELDKLVEVIKGIYGVKVIPNNAYPFLQDLRNGNKFFGKNDYKYKKGYSYDLIAETFEYCSDTIEYWLQRKEFNGFVGAFRYGLAIVCDKLSVVENKRRNKKAREHVSERRAEAQNVNNEYIEKNTTKNGKKKDELDISDLID